MLLPHFGDISMQPTAQPLALAVWPQSVPRVPAAIILAIVGSAILALSAKIQKLFDELTPMINGALSKASGKDILGFGEELYQSVDRMFRLLSGNSNSHPRTCGDGDF